MSPPGQVLSVRELWGSIRASVNQRATTAELWDAIRALAGGTGQTLPRGSFQEVNRMRSLATGLRNAVTAFDRAAPDALIDSSMIGQNIYSRDANAFALAPKYHVRYEVVSTIDGEEQSQWLSDVYTNLTATTKADLLNDLLSSALVSAASGSPVAGDIVDIGTVEISAV